MPTVSADERSSWGSELVALVDLIGRTGATDWQLRYSGGADDGDVLPVIWIAVARYPNHGARFRAAEHPVAAAHALARSVVDGGICVSCHLPTAISPVPERMADQPVCDFVLVGHRYLKRCQR